MLTGPIERSNVLRSANEVKNDVEYTTSGSYVHCFLFLASTKNFRRLAVEIDLSI